MSKKKRAADALPDAERTLPSAEFSLPPVEEVIVPWLAAAPSVPLDKAIHPRRLIPPVPEATNELDQSPSTAESQASTSSPESSVSS